MSIKTRAAVLYEGGQPWQLTELTLDPPKEREVLMLSAFEELSSVEIASVLGITESSVRSRLFRARNLMAELLQHQRSLR